WFATRVGRPTDVQARAWPVIAAGEHALVTAPTGSGKTLTAFLWALDRLLTGAWPPGGVRVLYVSPLKALNTDIRRNLLGPLAELRARFDHEGVPVPALHVQPRSGDTEPRDRRRLLRRPPEVLITTPESLNILLSTRPGRALFGELETVILDEIHAVAGTKRGTHLITAVDRLVPLAGEFQRIALSATVRPLETVAAFVGGFVRVTAGPDPDYAPRPVTIVQSDDSKELAARVRYPSPVGDDLDAWWEALTAELKGLIRQHRSTLLFTNSRRMCEKLSLFLNRDEDPPLAYSHHGSLSRETRQAVEERLKNGELKAIVATSSLELGIDIGALDQVLLVQTPPDVSAAVQRWGRAGHSVGEVSRGVIFPLHGRDLLRAAAMVPCVLAKDIEAVQPLSAPLDVLAQNLITMAGVESWDLDELYDELRCSWPFRWLSRRQYDLVLDMLAGRYSTTRLATLQPRVVVDRIANRLHSREGATRLARVSGGTIPDRGYFQLRHADTRARIGELDEEFVWERSAGDSFILGNQVWRILTITHNDVLAVPGRGGAMAPFWKGEEMSRGAHFATRCAELLEEADRRLDDPLFAADLRERCHLEPDAATALIDFLLRQRDHTGTPLPHRHHLLVELVEQPDAEPAVPQAILHTHWGRDLNRPYALALAGAWEEAYAEQLAFHADQDCIMLTPSREIGAGELLSLVAPDDLDRLLRLRLESSGLFGARFRENAARATISPSSWRPGAAACRTSSTCPPCASGWRSWSAARPPGARRTPSSPRPSPAAWCGARPTA
ncbi:MAG: DEAD/DEAH box helicase, partial [Armatimonadetes bacterium]|nr:DEAD/DEAH box helicase [Armatimonadota bacterium]